MQKIGHHCLRVLKVGVLIAGTIHRIAQELNGLLGIIWEDFSVLNTVSTTCPKRAAVSEISWLLINWTCWIREDFMDRCGIFVKIVKSLNSKKGFNVTCDLSYRNGTLVQIVQFLDPWTVEESIRWFSMYDVSDYDIKLGSAFGCLSRRSWAFDLFAF